MCTLSQEYITNSDSKSSIIEILLEKRKAKRICALNIATGILIPTLNVKSKGRFPVEPYRGERSGFHC